MAGRRARVAVVGVGGHGRNLAAAARAASTLEIAACFDANAQAAAKAGADLGCPVARSYDEVLADSSVAGVILATPNALHAPQTIAAARAGKHIFVEKPMANTLEEAREMILEARRAQVLLQVGHNVRRGGSYRLMKELVEQGVVGRVVMAEGNFGHDGGLRLKPDQWRWTWNQCPGGAMMLLGVHHADTLAWLCGPIKRVTAFMARVATQAEIEDACAVSLEFESGALGSINAGYAYPRQVHLNVLGTQANLLSDERNPYLLVVRSDGRSEQLPVEEGDTLKDEMEAFGRCILEGTRPEVAGEEGFHALAVVWAAIESSRAGKPVEVAPTP